ncbi:hypothetical protein, unlikely [Trypanosoma brucei brucei TREU927]|uniref:Uncharacterized protein n=1 Tax=Trypanosoma brucei brucei (strain 927/4 GUTat10.1) TaxID=185431 RepID=Q4GZ07_TRYB2|nr:hypothetical protein, unlikely [Trypanosoma brucei brucei TREU927]CAJ16298.1 hypothetical protein, unlikely [Trypanosoma brucei brucei TREU927]
MHWFLWEQKWVGSEFLFVFIIIINLFPFLYICRYLCVLVFAFVSSLHSVTCSLRIHNFFCILHVTESTQMCQVRFLPFFFPFFIICLHKCILLFLLLLLL